MPARGRALGRRCARARGSMDAHPPAVGAAKTIARLAAPQSIRRAGRRGGKRRPPCVVVDGQRRRVDARCGRLGRVLRQGRCGLRVGGRISSAKSSGTGRSELVAGARSSMRAPVRLALGEPWNASTGRRSSDDAPPTRRCGRRAGRRGLADVMPLRRNATSPTPSTLTRRRPSRTTYIGPGGSPSRMSTAGLRPTGPRRGEGGQPDVGERRELGVDAEEVPQVARAASDSNESRTSGWLRTSAANTARCMRSAPTGPLGSDRRRAVLVAEERRLAEGVAGVQGAQRHLVAGLAARAAPGRCRR